MTPRRRTFRGSLLRALAIGFLAVPAIVIVISLWPPPRKPARKMVIETAIDAQDQTVSRMSEPVVRPTESVRGTANVPPPHAHPLERQLDSLESSIVKIEAGEGEVSGLGTGFVIDESGLIATNYHVLADATSARARFKNGAAYEIVGYAAVDPTLDLAIVRLREPPENLIALKLAAASDPPRLSPVIAIGHPHGVEFSPFDGKVSRVLDTSDLPPRSQRNLRNLIEGDLNHHWIQHTANIAEGNSGGPLMNDRGEVLGINTWVDKNAGFGYALHARYVARLRESAGTQVVPLTQFAKQGARVVELLRRLSVPQLQKTFEQCRTMRWRPVSDADYDALQQLAWSITAINLPKTFAIEALEERSEELIRAADQIVAKLGKEKWDSLGQITLINELAANQVSRPLAGQFFFATVDRLCEGDNGSRGALLRLAGSDQMLFTPLDGQLVLPTAGNICLVLGVNFEGKVVRYGDNPLKLIVAPVIATRTILPLDSLPAK